VKRLIASCFLLIETGTDKIAGYYTLSATSVRANDLPTDILKRLPRYPIMPVALMGRLAIDRRFQLEATDENAVAFYRHHGFRPFVSRPLSLFLPLGTLEKGAAE
jgi:hypothetical protein